MNHVNLRPATDTGFVQILSYWHDMISPRRELIILYVWVSWSYKNIFHEIDSWIWGGRLIIEVDLYSGKYGIRFYTCLQISIAKHTLNIQSTWLITTADITTIRE